MKRGFCPTALTPMASGDGLLLRVRPPVQGFSPDDLRVISGLRAPADVTNRANLQLRGFDESGATAAGATLVAAGLAHPDPAVEAVRGVVLDPLAGIDPAGLADLRPLASEIHRLLEHFPALPSKFGIVLDGGGTARLGLAALDIRITALPDRRVRIQAGTGDFVCRLDQAAVRLADILDRHPGGRFPSTRSIDERTLPPGWFAQLQPDRFALTALVPLGRLRPEQLAGLAGLAHPVRLTPWRSLVVTDVVASDRQALAREVKRLGLIVDPETPWRHLVACVGRLGCVSAATDTAGHAAWLAARLPPGLPSRLRIHLSGCEKRCAHHGSADMTLVGSAPGSDRYSLERAEGVSEPLAASAALEAVLATLSKDHHA